MAVQPFYTREPPGVRSHTERPALRLLFPTHVAENGSILGDDVKALVDRFGSRSQADIHSI